MQLPILHLLSYIFPRTILKTSSPYNRDIRVVEESGKYKLLVNGSTETGQYIKKLLKFAVDKLGMSKEKNIRSVLVLGVAGGTIIYMLHALYPKAQITGVDIDSAMIEIGKKYFGLGSIKKLKLTVADAKDYLRRQHIKKYDVVVIDLFIGRDIPAFVSSNNFLTRIKTILTPRGFVLINYLKELEYGLKPSGMTKILRTVFKDVRSVDYQYNRFFLAKKSL